MSHSSTGTNQTNCGVSYPGCGPCMCRAIAKTEGLLLLKCAHFAWRREWDAGADKGGVEEGNLQILKKHRDIERNAKVLAS